MIKKHPTLGIRVSDDGQVEIPNQGGRGGTHWTFGSKQKSGYMFVSIRSKYYYVHRLVAQTFLPNPENKPEIDHINRDKSDNRIENIRWSTRSENSRNRAIVDMVSVDGRAHSWEDKKKYNYDRNKLYLQKTGRKSMLFSDGKRHWVNQFEYKLLRPFKPSQRIWRGRP